MIEEIENLEKNKKEFLRMKQGKDSELRYNHHELTKIEEELVCIFINNIYFGFFNKVFKSFFIYNLPFMYK